MVIACIAATAWARKALSGLLLTGTVLLALSAEELPGQELQTAQQVRTLTAEQAAQSLPVRLRGVVTFFDENLFSRFVQDHTAGIYLQESTNTPALTPGQVVEVQGVTSPGEYAPIIVPQKVRVVGETNLPPARVVNFDRLASGREDSQFVEVVGIVRSVYLDETSRRYVIEIATGGSRLKAYTRELPVADAAALVDSTVRVRGVCSTVFNRQRQLSNIRLMVPRSADLVIESPAPADPFAIPSLPIGGLLQFTPQGTYGHRVKVFGTVIYQDRGASLFIQNETQGLSVRTRQLTPLRLGDRVEVLGFPAQGDYTPVLEDAVYRKVSSGSEPRPQPVSLDDALKGTHDCRLIQVEGTLLDRTRQNHGQMLVIEAGGFLFRALLEKKEEGDAFQDLRNGSKVLLTGVCLIEPGDWQAGEGWRARSFQLLLRSPADVVVRESPPWWTLRKLLWMVGLLALIVLWSFTWVAVLRRRVQKQTDIIRQKLQAEAALKERYEVLFENANDMVFALDLEGRLTSINKTGERLLQRSREQLLNTNFLDLVAEDERPAARQWLQQAIQDADLPTAEWDFVNAAGQRAKVEISTRIIERDGKPAELEGIARNITERRRLEREILEISTREQRRIGHDLHDGVCQQLAGIAYRLAILGDRLQAKAAAESAEAEQIGNLINEANSQARTVARGLFPVRLEENGLVAALEELAEGTGSRFDANAHFSCTAPPFTVDNQVALHLYFIAQEALLNAIKHGKAGEVAIRLQPKGERLELMVQDNGKGFETPAGGHTGMGIRIMRYRARVIGATLEVLSRPAQGTRVSCVFSPAPGKNLPEVQYDGHRTATSSKT